MRHWEALFCICWFLFRVNPASWAIATEKFSPSTSNCERLCRERPLPGSFFFTGLEYNPSWVKLLMCCGSAFCTILNIYLSSYCSVKPSSSWLKRKLILIWQQSLVLGWRPHKILLVCASRMLIYIVLSQCLPCLTFSRFLFFIVRFDMEK